MEAKEQAPLLPTLATELVLARITPQHTAKAKATVVENTSDSKPSFCRIGGEHNTPTAKDQQSFWAHLYTATPFISGNTVYVPGYFNAYATHIHCFLQCLLYPKHSFW